VRPGGATREKRGILDGKNESGLMSDLELQGGSPRLCRLRTASGFIGSRKLSSLTVVELDDILHRFTDDIGIVFGPPTDYPLRFSRGRWH
jgi:hypothetical protein